MSNVLLSIPSQAADVVAGEATGPLLYVNLPAAASDVPVGPGRSFGELLRNLDWSLVSHTSEEGDASDPLASGRVERPETQHRGEGVPFQFEARAEIPMAMPQPQSGVTPQRAATGVAEEIAAVPAILSTFVETSGVQSSGAVQVISAQSRASQLAAPQVVAMESAGARHDAGSRASMPAVVDVQTLAVGAQRPYSESVRSATEAALAHSALQSATHPTVSQTTFVTDTAAGAPVERTGARSPQDLVALLGERLQVQIARRSEHAVVRLDPPSMGTIEIVIRHEDGQLHVHLRASNGEVARQLQVIGETLRQDLAQRQHETVSVQVSDWSREGERHRQPPQRWRDEPGRALNESGDEQDVFAMNVPSE